MHRWHKKAIHRNHTLGDRDQVRIITLFAYFLILATGSAARAADVPREAYTFGVFPYLSAARLEPIYVPVTLEISKALKRPVEFRTSTQFKRFFKKLSQQRFDFALIQPFWYPPSADRFNYLPLVRFEEPLTSLIMVLEDSPIKSAGDLRGKTVATPPSFVPVVHMARRALKDTGLVTGVDLQFKAYKSVDSCFQQVLIGNASACVAPNFAQKTIEEKLQVKLRTVVESPSIPNLSLVAHSRIPAEHREKVKNLLLSWGNGATNAADALLKQINTRRFVPAIDAEFDAVRTYLREIESAGN